MSVWFVRCSFIYLFLGFTLGGLILANKGFPFAPWIWGQLPAHMEFLLLGWMVQLTMGVAFWILPRFRSGPPRGNIDFVWSAFVILNMGIVLVSVQPFISMTWLTQTGRILEMISVLLLVFSLWQRVKPIEV
ncbi:MAG: hypothetical protein RBT80_25335 [Candidatus Vecturithrix sp.]|nr:hypothetical protein [Anaerolineales bacterium]MDY0096034.1 hypothetical protein [Candidatus Vecturithrix sp.]